MTSTTTARPRSLLPKEHGAWPQLLLPLATAWIARPSLPGALLASSAIAVFLAHEPALVLRGTRGRGALYRDGRRARRWLVTHACVAALVTVGAMVFAGAHAWRSIVTAALLTATSAAALLVLMLSGRERTDEGECVAATALSGAALPVCVAGGASLSAAVLQWIVWALGFIALTTAVRTAIAPSKGRDPRRSRRLAVFAAAALGACAPIARGATLPAMLAALWLLLAPPSVRHIRRTGWALAASSIATALWSIAVGR